MTQAESSVATMADPNALNRLADAADARAKWGRGSLTMPSYDSAGTSDLLEALATELRTLAAQSATPAARAVPEAVKLKADSPLGLARSGDWSIATSAWSTRICDARYAKGWNDCRDAMLAVASQHAVPAVDFAMVERYCEAAYQSFSALNPMVKDHFRKAVRLGLTAALTLQAKTQEAPSNG